MSRNEQRIRKALAARGWEASDVFWEPLSGSNEMAGPDGGWTVYFDPQPGREEAYSRSAGAPGAVVGVNVADVLDWIAALPDLTAT